MAPPAPAAFGEVPSIDLIRLRHEDLISRYATRRLGSSAAARVVVDRVFARAASQSDLPEHPLPWLVAAARRECVEHRQEHWRRARRPGATSGEGLQAPAA